MSNELKHALILAAVGIVGLSLARLFSSVADVLAVITVLGSLGVVWSTTTRAKKTTLRMFLLVMTALLVGSTFAMGVLLATTGSAVTTYLLLGAFMTVMVYYHTVHFLAVPADRSKKILTRTVLAAQVYVLTSGISAFFGFMILARMGLVWVLVLTVLGVFAAVYPWYRFALNGVGQQLIATTVAVLVITEITWASALLPFGYGVRGLFPGIAAALLLVVIAKINGEPIRDKTMKILYAAAAIVVGGILVFARWI